MIIIFYSFWLCSLVSPLLSLVSTREMSCFHIKVGEIGAHFYFALSLSKWERRRDYSYYLLRYVVVNRDWRRFYQAQRCQGIGPYLCGGVRYFQVHAVENEALPVFIDFTLASLNSNILNSSSNEDLIPLVHVSVMLILSNYVKNLSISIDESTEICWNILSTKLKVFCSEQLEITYNFTSLNTMAQNKNCRHKRQHI